MSQQSWDRKFINAALLVESWSKHPTTKVGCVIVDDDHNQLSGGYNGLPRGIDDTLILNQEREFSITVHAEANAVAAAARNGHSLKGGTAYITKPICCQCAALLIQAGIKRVFVIGEVTGKWSDNCREARYLMERAGVEITPK